MDAFPKIVYGCAEKTVGAEITQCTIFPRAEITSELTRIRAEISRLRGEKSSKNCNICRNCKNINDPKHRMSKVHQKKLTERFVVMKLKTKINTDSITVHDEEWEKEDVVFCYFCDKPVKKHKTDGEFTIEFMGMMIHYADSHHIEAVKSYLKRHGRNEDWSIFCRSNLELEKFKSNIPEAKRKYLKKLDILNEKDVKQIKETDLQRQQVVESAMKPSTSVDPNEGSSTKNEQMLGPSTSFKKKKYNSNSTMTEKPKIAPWLVGKSENESNVTVTSDRPVIGPTMETLAKHVENQAKKGLSMKRVKADLKQKDAGTSKWLPAFSGVWSKGRHRMLKSSLKKK